MSQCRALTYTSLTMILAKIRFMKPRHLFVLVCMTHIGWAQAEIYKRIDADGNVTYSSTPTKGSKKIDVERLPATSPPVRVRNSDASPYSPSDFPRVDSNTQKSRDGMRRKILEDELAAEKRLLAEAHQSLKESKEVPETPPKKMKTLQEQVSLHEKNVEALKSELANIK